MLKRIVIYIGLLGIILGSIGFILSKTVGFPSLFENGSSQNDDRVSNQNSGISHLQTGLILNDSRSCSGYTLLAPIESLDAYLIDNEGRIVHQWKCDSPGLAAYLLPSGHLLRATMTDAKDQPSFSAGGISGRVQEFTWEGELVWDFEYASGGRLLHHGIEPLPNGNYLMIAWEQKSAEEAIAAGRSPSLVDDHLWADSIIEVKPSGKTTGEIVWQWRVWDHLIQNANSFYDNYGVVADRPERVNINPIGWSDNMTPADVENLKSLGYIGGSSGDSPGQANPDWTHINSVSYNAELDQILLSVRGFNEIWVIDHGVTTQEAASHSGGKRGRGGDLLYRWGNPMAYGAGTAKDQQLFAQHDAQWIPAGQNGAEHILLFNNGRYRPDGKYSSVIEIELPLDQDGGYSLERGKPYNPASPIWSFAAPNKTDFYVPFLSSAQRLPNGNTLICDGMSGAIFEIAESGETVWKYVVPLARQDAASSSMTGYRVGVYAVRRYAPNYPGLVGKNLSPNDAMKANQKN